MIRRIYTFADFDGVDIGGLRIGGPGLGNNLFPWGRSAVFAHLTGAQQIRPTWAQFNPRRFLRRDADQRRYAGLARNPHDDIMGIRKYAVLARYRRVRVRNLAESLSYDGGSAVICHSGMGPLFSELNEWRELLRCCFMSLTPSLVRKDLQDSVVVHVRRGDFRTSGSESMDLDLLRRGEMNVRIPDAWYEEAVTAGRRLLGGHPRVYIVSDAPPDELFGIVRATGAAVVSSASPWQDLHTLIGAGVRVCSASTFSDWAAFISKGPSINIRRNPTWGDDGSYIAL